MLFIPPCVLDSYAVILQCHHCHLLLLPLLIIHSVIFRGHEAAGSATWDVFDAIVFQAAEQRPGQAWADLGGPEGTWADLGSASGTRKDFASELQNMNLIVPTMCG